MSKADRYAEREWLSQPRPKPAFEPYGGPQPAAPLDVVEWEDPPMVEHVTIATADWPGALTIHATEHSPATPEFMAALTDVFCPLCGFDPAACNCREELSGDTSDPLPEGWDDGVQS